MARQSKWPQPFHYSENPAAGVAEHYVYGIDHADGVDCRALPQQVCRPLIGAPPEEQPPASLEPRLADMHMHRQSAPIVLDSMRNHVRNTSMRRYAIGTASTMKVQGKMKVQDLEIQPASTG